MNQFEILKHIYDYIHEFEHQNSRAMEVQDFIDAIPVIYHIIKDSRPEILGDITKDEWILSSQLGYKYWNMPAGIRKQFIEQEYYAMGGTK